MIRAVAPSGSPAASIAWAITNASLTDSAGVSSSTSGVGAGTTASLMSAERAAKPVRTASSSSLSNLFSSILSCVIAPSSSSRMAPPAPALVTKSTDSKPSNGGTSPFGPIIPYDQAWIETPMSDHFSLMIWRKDSYTKMSVTSEPSSSCQASVSNLAARSRNERSGRSHSSVAVGWSKYICVPAVNTGRDLVRFSVR